MKHLVYIGNKLSHRDKTATTIDTLGKQLEGLGYSVSYASTYKNIFIRFLDMLYTVWTHRKTTNYVLIDTYSTLNFYYAYYVSRLCIILNLKYIPILHGGSLPKRLERSPKKSRLIFNHAYVNVAPSQYLMRYFKDFGYTNLMHIPNTIAIENYTYVERPLERIKLLWVRSFSNMYNPQLAVQLLKSLQEDGIAAGLCMIGPDNDGSMVATKALAQSLGVTVEFTGKLTKAQWHKKAEQYTVFINTTTVDNTPVSLVEAMALGLPIISTNVGGIPFLIENNEDGILVPPNNVNAFKEALLQLFENKPLTSKMTRKARQKAERFDWEVVKEKWLTVLT